MNPLYVTAMTSNGGNHPQEVPLGIGFYTVPEAARLLRVSALSVRRWLGGYTFIKKGKKVRMPPLWKPQLPAYEHHLELGFRDLIELRFVKAFIEAGLSLKTIRSCLEYAREVVKDERPFSTRRFQTDGRTIFLDSLHHTAESELHHVDLRIELPDLRERQYFDFRNELLDLRERQYVLKQIIERTFKDLDIESDAVTRWRPYGGKQSIVIDPQRAFGQPIAEATGVPTVTLADAVEAEQSVTRVAYLFQMTPSVVRDAIEFQKALLAA
jgi:uncharacterized protein (DUF433 family)